MPRIARVHSSARIGKRARTHRGARMSRLRAMCASCTPKLRFTCGVYCNNSEEFVVTSYDSISNYKEIWGNGCVPRGYKRIYLSTEKTHREAQTDVGLKYPEKLEKRFRRSSSPPTWGWYCRIGRLQLKLGATKLVNIHIVKGKPQQPSTIA